MGLMLLYSDGKEGKPWAKVWNSIIKRCDGFVHELEAEDDDVYEGVEEEDEWDDILFGNLKSPKLPCYPSTVVYGHTASRRLDLKRWSKGIDTGCVCLTIPRTFLKLLMLISRYMDVG